MSASSEIRQKLATLGLSLPDVPTPAGNYVQARRVGDLLFVSGQGPRINGKLQWTGRVGAEVTLQDAYAAARCCALNALAVAVQFAGEKLCLPGVLQVRGFVSSDDGFHAQPKVLDGASDLYAAVFGEAGRHVRAALGTSTLPGNIPVEIEVIFLAGEPASSTVASGAI